MKKFISLLAVGILLFANSALATWYPISLQVPQYVDSNGNPYSGAVLKAYSAGTSTAILMATDNTGATTASSTLLNSAGYTTISGNVIIPYLEEDFKLALYPTQTAADANSGAIWTVDNIPIVGTDFDDITMTGTTTVEDLVVGGDASFGDIIVNDSINDTNSNELLEFGVTSSAVNNIKITNSATGNNPQISAVGGDSDIGMNFLTKGVGVFRFLGNSLTSAALRLYEDTDNGSNYIGLKAPSSIASDIDWTLPSADGASGQTIITNGSGTLSFAGGRILQVVDTANSTYTSTSGTIPKDNTIPQSGEGAEFTQVATAITPTSATSTLIIEVWAPMLVNSATDVITVALFKDSGADALAATGGQSSNSTTSFQGFYFTYKETSGNTTSRTYKLRYGGASGTTYINGSSSAGLYGGVMTTRIRVTEIGN